MFTERMDIGEGEEAVERTINKMVHYAISGGHDTMVILTAQNIVRRYPSRMEQAVAIYRWVKEHTVYVKDPTGLEMLQTPRFMLLQIANGNDPATADCDCLSTLAAALLVAAGFPAGFRVINRPMDFLTGDPYNFAHIYNIVWFEGRPVPFDLSEKDFRFGQEHFYVIRKDVPINA